MPWTDIFAPLPALVTELRGIREQLTRMANAYEEIPPPRVESPPAPEDPAEVAPAQTDREFALIESIEQRWLALGGRLPTPEEIGRELDGLEIPEEVSAAALKQHRDRRGGVI